MQRQSISVDDQSNSSPTYPPSASMYDPSSQMTNPPVPSSAYYPYPPDPNSAGNTWTPYPSQADYNQPPPQSGQNWYAPPVAGPSVPYHPSQSSSPYTGQPGAYPRAVYPNEFQTPTAASKIEKPKTKKKRKPVEKEGSIGSPGDADKEKRTKTGRACDACRTKKIRCDILPQAETDESTPICAHCKQYNLECTFFLPITETRFKKKRNTAEKERTPVLSQTNTLRATSPARPPGEVPGRIEGPTSLSFLLHTSVPASASEAYDLRYHNSWELSEDGNGLIRVTDPPSSNAARYADNDDNLTQSHNKLNRPILNAHTISLLVNAYFDHLAQLFPIISRAEFAAKQTPPPLLLYGICGVASTRRSFPREVFAGVRGVINGFIRSNDVLSDARIENVQALLVLAQVGDLHAQPTAATASACLMRTGSAIRMAQDLGLHREGHIRTQTPQDLAYVELRRRIWATCVIMDRWYGAALGLPLHVDLLDCDVLLPAGYEIILDQDPSTWPIEPSFVALTEHLKLSILIGRVLKTVYSPTGLKHATDEQLYSILEDTRSWQEGLPDDLKYSGRESSFAAGGLHLAYTTLHFLLWRPFMRITYICPPHLQFALETMHWSQMMQWATEALDWLNYNGEALDTSFIYAYTATSCALVQYHTWVRRREPSSLDSLMQVRETASQWEAAVQPDQMSIRRKTCETMTLLYEAALKTNPEDERPPAINPTPGVLPRAAVGKAVWVADASKPYGGIWVARDDEEKQSSGLAANSVVTQKEMSDDRPAPELESSHPAIRARAISGLRGSGEEDDTGSRDSGSRSGAGSVVGGTTILSQANGIKGEIEEHTLGNTTARNSINYTGDSQNGSYNLRDSNGSSYPPQQQQQDPMQSLREMQIGGSNVNPQMNFTGLDFGGIGAELVPGMGYNIDPNVAYGDYDLSGLDNTPANGFNLDQWNSWLSNVERVGPPPDGYNMAGMDQGRQHQMPQQTHQQWGNGGG